MVGDGQFGGLQRCTQLMLLHQAPTGQVPQSMMPPQPSPVWLQLAPTCWQVNGRQLADESAEVCEAPTSPGVSGTVALHAATIAATAMVVATTKKRGRTIVCMGSILGWGTIR